MSNLEILATVVGSIFGYGAAAGAAAGYYIRKSVCTNQYDRVEEGACVGLGLIWPLTLPLVVAKMATMPKPTLPEAKALK